jgi:hypothetical protein
MAWAVQSVQNIGAALNSTYIAERVRMKNSRKENTVNALIFIDGILYAGISIIAFVGGLTMCIGMVAGK